MDISILIVDDDKYLVDKLEETVQWEKIGISMVFTAYNIRQAQKLLAEFPIQLLLCDIDMPQGSGLELLEWIRNQDHDQELECVFLSSYANFAYAQKALRLSTREYLLKPISNQELESVLARVVQEYNRRMNLLSGQNRDGGCEEIWEEFLVKKPGELAILEKAVAEGRYRWEDELYLQMIQVYMDPQEEGYRKKMSLLHQKICNLAHDILEEAGCAPEAVVRVRERGWVLVAKRSDGMEAVCESPEGWKRRLDSSVGCPVCLYIGRAYPLREMAKSWERLEKLENQFLPGEDGILSETYVANVRGEADGLRTGPDPAPEEESAKDEGSPEGNRREPCGGTEERREAVYAEKEPGCDAGNESLPWEIWQKSTDLAEELPVICDQIREWLKRTFAACMLTRSRLERFLKETEQFLYGYLGRKGLDFSELYDSGEFISKEKGAHISLDGTLEFIGWMFGTLEGHCLNEKKQKDVVGQVKDYIEKNLGSGISRSVLAKEVWLSEDYVSKLFKSTTGMSLPAYIAARRIERAKEYLAHSTLPVSRIAMEVGYSNFSYFSKTFRDATGMTPNEYRSRQADNKKTN